jgi:hypothetical protein
MKICLQNSLFSLSAKILLKTCSRYLKVKFFTWHIFARFGPTYLAPYLAPFKSLIEVLLPFQRYGGSCYDLVLNLDQTLFNRSPGKPCTFSRIASVKFNLKRNTCTARRKLTRLQRFKKLESCTNTVERLKLNCLLFASGMSFLVKHRIINSGQSDEKSNLWIVCKQKRMLFIGGRFFPHVCSLRCHITPFFLAKHKDP